MKHASEAGIKPEEEERIRALGKRRGWNTEGLVYVTQCIVLHCREFGARQGRSLPPAVAIRGVCLRAAHDFGLLADFVLDHMSVTSAARIYDMLEALCQDKILVDDVPEPREHVLAESFTGSAGELAMLCALTELVSTPV